MMKTILTALLISAAGLPLAAQDTLGTPVTGRVLQGWLKPDGTRVAALELRLEKGWKTYWRVPGDAGIPPQFNWKKSRNLRNVEIMWPTPQVTSENGMRSIGYKDRLVIPLGVTPKTAGKAIRLRARMNLGICSDICVPYTLDFDGTLDGNADQPTPAIAAALAQLPYSGTEAGVRKATCALSPTEDGLTIETRVSMPSLGGQEIIVIEAGQPGIWVSDARTSRQGNTLVATAHMMQGSGGSFALDRSQIRITVIATGASVDLHGCSAS